MTRFTVTRVTQLCVICACVYLLEGKEGGEGQGLPLSAFPVSLSARLLAVPGLWPSDFSGNYPCLCSNETFDINQIASLVPQMNTYWPSYNCSNQVCAVCNEPVFFFCLCFVAAVLQP